MQRKQQRSLGQLLLVGSGICFCALILPYAKVKAALSILLIGLLALWMHHDYKRTPWNTNWKSERSYDLVFLTFLSEIVFAISFAFRWKTSERVAELLELLHFPFHTMVFLGVLALILAIGSTPFLFSLLIYLKACIVKVTPPRRSLQKTLVTHKSIRLFYFVP
jgi:hypothetical protein